jgi:hypothetical protein
VLSFTPQTLYPQGKSWYRLDRRLDEPQSRSGCGGEDKNSQTVPGLESSIEDQDVDMTSEWMLREVLHLSDWLL